MGSRNRGSRHVGVGTPVVDIAPELRLTTFMAIVLLGKKLDVVGRGICGIRMSWAIAKA
jgi:hypothetical protein